jgi:acyl-CoA hydrolase
MQKHTKFVSAEEAVKHVSSGNRVFIHGSAATPKVLLKALVDRKKELKNVELVSVSTVGFDLNDESFEGHFFINSLFVSESVRKAVNSSRGDYIPVFLSEIPGLFHKNILPLDIAMLHVSVPDKHGYVSLGTSVDVARAAAQTAKIIIAQINPQMPRTHGDTFLHISKIDYAVYVDELLPEVSYSDSVDEACEQIGKNVAALVEDGATLQLGIGSIPDNVLKNLGSHRNLGLHTEMFSDGAIDLIEKGIINNSKKRKVNGYCVSGFLLGSKRLYDFVDDNPIVKCMDISYVNDPHVVKQNPKVTAINSAIELDLTGQVCADSIGMFQYSGIGGQMDFIRGASLSEGGKPIIALPSRTGKGVPRLVPTLKTGGGVVTTRGHVHWVVTEYGAVNLYGRNMEQRADLLISIAHPDDRELLGKAAWDRFNK